MKRLQLQRFDLLSADLDHATLATQLKWPFNIGGSEEVHLYTILGMTKWPRIGG